MKNCFLLLFTALIYNSFYAQKETFNEFNVLDKKIVRKIITRDTTNLDSLFFEIKKIKVDNKQDSLNARLNHLLGSYYYNINDYKLAMDYWIKAVDSYEVIKDSLAISKLYNNISLILNNAKEFEKSLELKKKALLFCPETVNPSWHTVILHNIGHTYYYLKEIDSSSKYVNLSYIKAIKYKDSSSIASTLNTISEHFLKKKDYKNALVYADSVQNQYRKYVNQSLYENSLYYSSVAYYRIGRYEDALKKAQQSLQLILDNGMLINASENYEHISKIYHKLQKPELALEALQQSKKFADSVFTINQQKTVLELERKYESEKKEKENIILKEQAVQKDLSISKKNNVILVSSLTFGVIIILLIAYQLKKTKKSNVALKKSIIIREKAEKELETVRNNISKDFHDDLGNRLARITTLSDLILRTKEKREKEEILDAFKVIKQDSDILYSGTRDFMFSLKAKSDFAEELFTYLSDFGEEFYASLQIDFFVKKHLEKNIKLPYYWNRQIVFIFKEAMTNIAKHSKANNVTLNLSVKNDVLEISLYDDGKGFNKNELKRKNGLLNMKNRAKKIDAEFSIETNSKGTKIFFKASL